MLYQIFVPSDIMGGIILSCTIYWFTFGTFFFYLAVQHSIGFNRWALCLFHVLSMVNSLLGADLLPTPYSRMWAQFVVWAAIHTFLVLFVENKVIHQASSSTLFTQRLKAIFRVWSNIRRLPLQGEDTSTAVRCSTDNGIGRHQFALKRCTRVLALWLMKHNATGYITRHFLLSLEVNLQDFAPPKQAIWPSMIEKDLCLRAFFSIYWIWDTYTILTISHDLFAIFFVCIMHWDMPQEWPPLFGNITEAYSLRRFWGVFWHRLHVAPFTILMPSYLHKLRTPQVLLANSYAERRMAINMIKALRAFWIFLLSGTCHILVNFVTVGKGNAREEFRFFLLNYVLCFLETILEPMIRRKCRQVARHSTQTRLLGYGWVFIVFFCLVPAWLYPSIHIRIISMSQV